MDIFTTSALFIIFAVSAAYLWWKNRTKDVKPPVIEKDIENGLRLTLLMNMATDTLRTFMHRYLPVDPNALNQKLNKRNIWLKLNNLKNQKVIKADQWNVIFPNTAPYLPDPKQFDVSIIIILLNKACNVNNMYKKYIDDLRKARNKYAHSLLNISDPQFNVLWTEFEVPMTGLGCAKEEIEKLKSCIIDNNQHASLIEAKNKLKAARKQVEKLEKAMDGVFWDVSDKIKSFTGREKDIKTLHNALVEKKHKAVAVYGLSGVGKSELARVYCHKYSASYKENIMWINAENSSTTEESFSKLAAYIGLSCMDETGKALDGKVTAARVYNYFAKTKCLFVFDDVKDFSAFQQYAPNTLANYQPTVLITSQYSYWSMDIKGIKLNPLSVEESQAFYEKYLLHRPFENEITKLSQLLGNLPLALNLSLAYINERCITVTEYISKFNKYFQNVCAIDTSNKNMNTKKNILTTWNMAFDALTNESLALNLIKLFAIMDGRCIQRKILDYLPGIKDIDLDDSLHVLSAYSLIDINYIKDTTTSTISMHSLVQNVVLQTKLGEDSENYEDIVINLSKACNSVIDVEKNRKHFDFGDAWSNHIFYFVSKLPITLECKSDLFACIESVIRAYWNKGQLVACQEFVKCVSENLQLNSEQIFIVKVADAKGLYKQGYYHEARLLLEEANGSLPTTLTDTERSLRAQCKIGKCLQKEGEYESAIKIYQGLLDKYVCKEGMDYQVLYKLSFHIGSCLRDQGNLNKAMQTLEDVYQKQKTLLGVLHGHTMTTKFHIACCLFNQGFYAKAKDIYNELYEQKLNLYGELHYETLSTKCSIASCLAKQGNYAKSLLLYQYAYKNEEEILGELHPSTLTTQYQIAGCLADKGLFEEALGMLKNVCEKRSKIFGECHHTTLATKNNIACCKKYLGCYEEALALFQDVYEEEKKLLGELHPSTLVSKCNIAGILKQCHDYDKALEMYTGIYEQQIIKLGKTNPSSLVTLNNIASCWKDQGYHGKALKIYEDVYAEEERLFGNSNPSTLVTKFNIANCHQDQGFYEEALEEYKQVYETGKSCLGELNPVIMKTKLCIGVTLTKLQHFDDARAGLSQVQKELLDNYGASYDLTKMCIFWINICNKRSKEETSGPREMIDIQSKLHFLLKSNNVYVDSKNGKSD